MKLLRNGLPSLALCIAGCSSPPLPPLVEPAAWESTWRHRERLKFRPLGSDISVWVPADRQDEAIKLLLDVSWVALDEAQSRRFGGAQLWEWSRSAGDVYLLRGVRVLAEQAGEQATRGDHLAVQWAGTIFKVQHTVLRPYPFDEKAAQAVIALLPHEPTEVLSMAAIIFSGGVSF